MIYIIMPVVALVLGYIMCREGYFPAGKALYCLLTGFGLFTAAALRYAVGYDYILYSNWYRSLRPMSVDELTEWSREKGFAYPAKILADKGIDEQIFFAVIALIIAAGVMLLIYKYSPAPPVSVTMLFVSGLYFNSMNFMRQFIAALIIAFALRYITEKRFFRFAGLVLFASVFHFSALILIPFYFILNIRLNLISFGILSVFSIIIYIFATPIMQIVTEEFYTIYDPTTHTEASGGLPSTYTVAFAVFFLLCFLLKKLIEARNRHANTLLMSLFFAVFFALLGTSHGILSRFALLFVIAPVLILSADIFIILRDLIKLTFRHSRSGLRICAAVISLIFLTVNGLYYSHLLSVNYNGVVPYQTIYDRESILNNLSGGES